MKSDKIPEITLEKYILKELPEKRMREIAAMAETDPGLMQRIEALKESNLNILEAHPPQEMAAAIERRYRAATRTDTVRQDDRPGLFGMLMRPRVLGPVMAAVTAAVVIAVFIPGTRTAYEPGYRNGIETTRVKGDGNNLYIYRNKNSSVELISNGAPAREGDLLQIACRTSENSYGAVLSIDGRGAVTMHLPADGGRAVRLEPGKKLVLPKSYELDDAPHFERFFFITSKSSFSLDRIMKAAGKLALDPDRARKAGLELGSGIEQTSMLIVKEGKS